MRAAGLEMTASRGILLTSCNFRSVIRASFSANRRDPRDGASPISLCRGAALTRPSPRAFRGVRHENQKGCTNGGRRST